MLTTEQKINLLILAGYNPRTSYGDPRIVRHDACLYFAGGEWFLLDTTFNPHFYACAAWGEMRVDSIPDELIHEACDVNH